MVFPCRFAQNWKAKQENWETYGGEEKPEIDILDPDFYKPIFRGKGEVLSGN